MSAGDGPGFIWDRRRCRKAVALGLAAWLPAAAGLWLLGRGLIGHRGALVAGLAGAAVAAGAALAVSVRRRRPAFRTGVLPGTARPEGATWSDMADPAAIHANRWAAYESLAAWIAQRDWRGRCVAEIGGSNAVLRRLMPGAEYHPLVYPEHDVQHLDRVGDGRFDAAIVDQTLEHVPDPEAALRELHRVLKDGGVALIALPFFVPVHPGADYGDYCRWTPQGLAVVLGRCGFEAQVGAWGDLDAAVLLMKDMYLRADEAMRAGLDLSGRSCDERYPVAVWAVATARKEEARRGA